MKKGKGILKCALSGLVLLLAVGGVVMLLWNWLVPALFNGPGIGYFQALGLWLLCKILFGGWRGFGRRGHPGESWKYRLSEKLSSMSEEDRERFKARMREKWCCGSPASPADTHDANG